MAEVIVNVDQNSTYEDGDILCAFNDRNVQCTHAQQICHYQHEGFTTDGLRPEGKSLAFLDCVYQYRFERVNQDQVKRIETDHLGNVLAEETFGKADMDVQQFVSRRLKHAKHRIFGTPGAEIWHGGRSDFSDAAVAKTWDIIQNNSDHRNAAGICTHCGQDHTLWPMGRLDVRHFLCAQLDNFSEVEAAAMTSEYSATFQPGDTITDADGGTVTPTWSDEGLWEHPTGGWIYTKDPETNIVTVTFKKRNMKVSDWRTSVLDTIQKTETEVLDKNILVGREAQAVVENAPWLGGNALTHKVLDHAPFTDPAVLYNKRDNRPGERLP